MPDTIVYDPHTAPVRYDVLLTLVIGVFLRTRGEPGVIRVTGQRASIDLIDDRQEQETPLYYDTQGGSCDRGLSRGGRKAGAKLTVIWSSGASSGALPNNRLDYRSNEAIKLDATTILLIDAKRCTDQNNSDLEVINYPSQR